MLERLKGNRISDNISINRQKAVKVAVDGKGVRYDVYVEDDDRTMYDTEMQRSENKSILPKRSRFYQGLRDLGYLEVGDEYTKRLHSSVAIAEEPEEDISVITDICKTAKTYAPDYTGL